MYYCSTLLLGNTVFRAALWLRLHSQTGGRRCCRCFASVAAAAACLQAKDERIKELRAALGDLMESKQVGGMQ